MSDKISTGTQSPAPGAAKRRWVRPAIEIAAARQAEAFAGLPGGTDYGIYS